MAEIPSQQTPTPAQSPPATDSDPVQYWCYQCDKRVSVETLENLPDVVCDECKNGFVEVIAASSLPSRSSDQADEPSFNNQFLQVLRLIAQAAREDDEQPPPPTDDADPQDADDDYLRIELDGWENDDDDDDEEEGDEDADDGANEDGVRNEGEEEDENDQDRSDGEIENHEGGDEEDMRRRRRDLLRLRLRDLATRAASRRNRILDWAEILMGLEDHSIEIRLQAPEIDGYVGNPEDYVDAAGYEALLQNLAESDSGGRRGAPPAAKSAILALPMLEIKSEKESFVCAICKDSVNVGDMVKKLPCDHGYHEDCIVPWLGSRNSCPVCRFELETEDAEYEEEKKKKRTMFTAHTAPSSSGS